ncbi:MAG TPA: TldD/PmbA family protein [Thermoplasmata archaeon]|nr:TldD/PmbA family protein [Thermoplasmata archaeon]
MAEDLARIALSVAEAAGVRYADVRIVAPQRTLHLAIRDGQAHALTDARSESIGVRVRTDQAWGFAGTSELSPAAAREAARTAVRLARAAGRSAPGRLKVTDDPPPREGRYSTPLKTDPFEVPRETIVGLLSEAESRLHVRREIKTGVATFQAWDETKTFGSTEGGSFSSRIVHVGAGISATAVRGSNVQRRSAPTSFGGDFRQAGFEFVESLALVERAERVGEEAATLLDAPVCPTGTMTLVLGSDQLGLQVHESVGHAVELDRIFGSEAAYAGTSWVPAARIGSLRYGSNAMNVVADATEPGGLGTFGWDDEGVPGQRLPIIDRGTLVGVLSSRESAAELGLPRSGGTARADGADRAPLVRMTNVDLLPGDLSLEEVLRDVTDGVYLETNRSWSIDDKRLNFQFGTEIGRRIVRGELGEIVRNPIYAGMGPTFWSSMDAVGNATTWHLWGVPNCGKGQPGQIARVSHGAPVARFRNVSVRGG